MRLLLVLFCTLVSVASSLMIDHHEDLLMMESRDDDGQVVIVEPPVDMLRIESREAVPDPVAMALAAPERSSIDEEQFLMAANYLKAQFSIPHHLVPQYQDVSQASLMKRRLSHLPNIENHRFDPDISPYDLPKVEDFKKVPDRYKNAPIYDMKGDRGHSRRNNRRKDVVRDQNIRKSDSIKNFPREEFKIPRIPNSLRQSPGSNNRPGFLSTILSPLNPFKSLAEKTPSSGFMKDVRNIPDRFKYPLPREHSSNRHHNLNNNMRNQGFDRRKLDHERNKPNFDRRNHELQRKKPDLNIRNQGPSRIQHDKERRKFDEVLRKPTFTKSKVPNRRRNPPVDYKERRKEKYDSSRSNTLRRRISNTHNSNTDISGLDLSFWVDDVDLSTTAKPDYRQRWQNLSKEYESNSDDDAPDSVQERVSVIDDIAEDDIDEGEIEETVQKQESPNLMFSDWGDSMWDEIRDDWDNEDDFSEDMFRDVSARYLNAWADVARIGTTARHKQEGATNENHNEDGEMKTNPGVSDLDSMNDQRMAPSKVIRSRRPIQRTRII